jgi:hypothetical protein
MIHHIAMFRFRDDITDDVVAEIRADLLSLPGKIDSIRSYQVGRDLDLSATTWDMVVIGGFDDEAGYQAYSSHPEHLPVVARIGGLITDRAALQTAEIG